MASAAPLAVASVLPLPAFAAQTESAADFGAVGDGRSDDRDAIQSALDAMQKGTVLRLPAGVYRLTDILYVTSASGITIEGDGANRTYLVADSQTDGDPLLLLDGVTDVTFRRLTLRSSCGPLWTAAGEAGIDASAVERFAIEDCSFEDLHGRAIGGVGGRVVITQRDSE